MILEDKIESVFGSCFSTHGLGGVLTCGVIGMSAGLSHSPVENVSLLAAAAAVAYNTSTLGMHNSTDCFPNSHLLYAHLSSAASNCFVSLLVPTVMDSVRLMLNYCQRPATGAYPWQRSY